MFVCINGKFLKKEEAKISVFDNGFMYGDGIYETLRVYSGVIFDFDSHFKRLQKSAELTGLTVKWPKSKIESWAKKVVKLNRGLERLRITISRGENGLDFNSCKNPTLVIHAEKLLIKPEIYKNGVLAATLRMERINPEAKTLGLTHMILSQRFIQQKKVDEVIMIDEKDFVREGPATNVFMVKNGVVYTPEKHILLGTTRKKILEIGDEIGLKMVVGDFKIGELDKAEEVFLTNKIKEIIPVRSINGKKVGNGKVGEITKKLMKLYRASIEAAIV